MVSFPWRRNFILANRAAEIEAGGGVAMRAGGRVARKVAVLVAIRNIACPLFCVGCGDF
jgi:hypothetical protein